MAREAKASRAILFLGVMALSEALSDIECTTKGYYYFLLAEGWAF
jgi:hypothetical protein